MVNLTKFSESLAELMQEKNLSVKDLAKATGIKGANIYYYLRAERLPSVESVIALADYFKCSTDFLLGLTDENTGETFKSCPPFSDRLDFLIKYFKVSAYKIYTHTNVSKARFFDWKRGKYMPSLDNIIKLSEFFDCSVDFILGRG